MSFDAGIEMYFSFTHLHKLLDSLFLLGFHLSTFHYFLVSMCYVKLQFLSVSECIIFIASYNKSRAIAGRTARCRCKFRIDMYDF